MLRSVSLMGRGGSTFIAPVWQGAQFGRLAPIWSAVSGRTYANRHGAGWPHQPDTGDPEPRVNKRDDRG
ncbi:hypothetical protein JOF40_001537 [Aeromicrobium fastidiosum]|nr:hypothetical protein [Aeromicrobium fastidiosum]